jgi:hypothetical protein
MKTVTVNGYHVDVFSLLAIEQLALYPEFRCYTSGAVAAMIQADLMQLAAQLRFRLPRCMFLEVPIKPRPAQMRRIASFCDG